MLKFLKGIGKNIKENYYNLCDGIDSWLMPIASQRKKYLDDTPTPLFRGVIISIFGFASLGYTTMNYSTLTNPELIALTGFVINGLLSFMYHNIYFDQYEKIIAAMDHIAISLVVWTNCMPFYQTNYLLHFIPYGILTLIDSINLFIDYPYTQHPRHRIIQGSLIAMTLIYMIYNISFVLPSTTANYYLAAAGTTYVLGQIRWVLASKPDAIYYWGYHETFHISVIVGHLLTLKSVMMMYT
jgi:predicted membrane channel-forming protein YqfA (hemolysin III family)